MSKSGRFSRPENKRGYAAPQRLAAAKTRPTSGRQPSTPPTPPRQKKSTEEDYTTDDELYDAYREAQEYIGRYQRLLQKTARRRDQPYKYILKEYWGLWLEDPAQFSSSEEEEEEVEEEEPPKREPSRRRSITKHHPTKQ